jgi:hypothetical protein
MFNFPYLSFTSFCLICCYLKWSVLFVHCGPESETSSVLDWFHSSGKCTLYSKILFGLLMTAHLCLVCTIEDECCLFKNCHITFSKTLLGFLDDFSHLFLVCGGVKPIFSTATTVQKGH